MRCDSVQKHLYRDGRIATVQNVLSENKLLDTASLCGCIQVLEMLSDLGAH